MELQIDIGTPPSEKRVTGRWRLNMREMDIGQADIILLCQVLKVDLPDYDWDRARARGDIPPEKVSIYASE